MTKRRATGLLLLAALTALPIAAAAQTTDNEGSELGARLSLAVDKKLSKGLHIAAKEEVRLDNNLGSLSSLRTTVGGSYKASNNLRFGAGYVLIAPYGSNSGAFKSVRHRFMAEATGAVRIGEWRLSLRERMQATLRTGDYNAYQLNNPQLGLKSRLKAQYKGWRMVEPYASVELRHTLNAPRIVAQYDGTNYLTAAGSAIGTPGWFISGSKAYLDRVRMQIGTSISIDKHQSIDIGLTADRHSELKIDANADGTRLKAYTLSTSTTAWLTAGYEYKF